MLNNHTGVIMNNDKKLYRIAENLASDLYSFEDGETDVNRIYKVLELIIFNARYFKETLNNDTDRVWFFVCTYCNLEHVYQSALNQYKDTIMAMINK